MGWFDGWPFKSKAQMEKDQAAFEQRLFPLGMAQRDKAAEVLKAVTSGRQAAQEVLFSFIHAKDAYTRESEPDAALQRADAALNRLRWKVKADRHLVLALVLLDVEAQSLEDYPTVADVQTMAAQLEG